MSGISDTQPTVRHTRKGSCLCGAFAYELTAPELTEAGNCNCSVCSKKGYLFVFVGADDTFTVTKGSEEDLTSYTFGAGNLIHKFCPACGTGVMATMPKGPPGFQIAVNIHSIVDIDSWGMTRRQFDGAALGTPYEPPPHKGALPEVQDGERVYTGSCHCGGLTVAVAAPPLDETYPHMVRECNCSSCERNANIWIYPLRNKVVLAGDAALRGDYSYGLRVGAKTFCRRCGVSMTNDTRALTDAQLAAIEDDTARSLVASAYMVHPVNARTLHGIELAKLPVGKSEGRKQ